MKDEVAYTLRLRNNPLTILEFVTDINKTNNMSALVRPDSVNEKYILVDIYLTPAVEDVSQYILAEAGNHLSKLEAIDKTNYTDILNWIIELKEYTDRKEINLDIKTILKELDPADKGGCSYTHREELYNNVAKYLILRCRDSIKNNQSIVPALYDMIYEFLDYSPTATNQ